MCERVSVGVSMCLCVSVQRCAHGRVRSLATQRSQYSHRGNVMLDAFTAWPKMGKAKTRKFVMR